jgi:hypothetical protein
VLNAPEEKYNDWPRGKADNERLPPREDSMKPLFTLLLTVLLQTCPQTAAQAQTQRTLSGVITTGRN